MDCAIEELWLALATALGGDLQLVWSSLRAKKFASKIWLGANTVLG